MTKSEEQHAEEEEEVVRRRSPFSLLYDALRTKCKELSIPWTAEMARDLPAKWEKHGDMVLLPDSSFRLNHWRMVGKDLWPLVAECLKVSRIGRKKRIADDAYRTPHIDLLFGDHGWVEHVDNHIRYQYDVRKCMFSIGNITEKLRIAEFDCKDEVVVDMFAGIGYFTLPYLVHARCAYLYACEWNQDAVEALRRNLSLNRVADRCSVKEGDCRKHAPMGVADRVNLGLLPTAHAYWLTACRALKKTGGYLHIHENIVSSRALSPGSRRGGTPPRGGLARRPPNLARRNSSPAIPMQTSASATQLNVVSVFDNNPPNANAKGGKKEKMLRRAQTQRSIDVPETVYEMVLCKDGSRDGTNTTNSLAGSPPREVGASKMGEREEKNVDGSPCEVAEKGESVIGSKGGEPGEVEVVEQKIATGRGDVTKSDKVGEGVAPAEGEGRKGKERKKPVRQTSCESSGYASGSDETTRTASSTASNANGASAGGVAGKMLPEDAGNNGLLVTGDTLEDDTGLKPRRRISMTVLSNLDQEFAQPFTVRISPEFAEDWEHAIDPAWREWALRGCQELLRFLLNIHDEPWSARVHRIGRVKRYAPHIDHTVMDVELRPSRLIL